MERFKRNWIFYVLILLDFYLFPLWMTDTGSAMFFLLLVMPLLCFAISLAYGLKNKENLLFPLFTAILFIPSIFLFYNASAWIYPVIYATVSLLGCLSSSLFKKR